MNTLLAKANLDVVAIGSAYYPDPFNWVKLYSIANLYPGFTNFHTPLHFVIAGVFPAN